MKDKYSNILNSAYDRTEGTVSQALHCVSRKIINFTSVEEICLCAIELSNCQSPGVDGIPNEFYRRCPWFSLIKAE